MKNLPCSLEIKLREKLSKTDILDILSEHMTMFEETFGIEEFKLNSYLEFYIDSKKLSLYHEEHNNVINSINLKSDEKLENTAKISSKDCNYPFSIEERKWAAEAVADCYKRIENGTVKRLKSKG